MLSEISQRKTKKKEYYSIQRRIKYAKISNLLNKFAPCMNMVGNVMKE